MYNNSKSHILHI